MIIFAFKRRLDTFNWVTQIIGIDIDILRSIVVVDHLQDRSDPVLIALVCGLNTVGTDPERVAFHPIIGNRDLNIKPFCGMEKNLIHNYRLNCFRIGG